MEKKYPCVLEYIRKGTNKVQKFIIILQTTMRDQKQAQDEMTTQMSKIEGFRSPMSSVAKAQGTKEGKHTNDTPENLKQQQYSDSNSNSSTQAFVSLLEWEEN